MTSPRLLIVEDDPGLASTLQLALTRRGYSCFVAASTEIAEATATEDMPQFAVVDLKLPGRSGLECVRYLASLSPPPRIVVLTGFASIATAVEAIKLGACHYLAKPATASDIVMAFGKLEGDASIVLTKRRSNLRTIEWERIQETLRDTDFNISEAARRLGMHRRTLARKLAKQQVQ